MKPTTRFGTWMSIGSPAIVELAAECGVDWVLLDMEHGACTEERLPDLLRALRGSETRGIVRVPTIQPDLIGRVLDRGADGIMVPHVRSAAEAEMVVQAMRYPPVGSRGVSRTVRAYGYGLQTIDDRIAPLFFAQIEDLLGVDNAAAIAAVDGVDTLFVGPADLNHALSHAATDITYESCLARVTAAATSVGKSTGILTRDRSTIPALRSQGFCWIAVGSDLGVLRDAFVSLKSDH